MTKRKTPPQVDSATPGVDVASEAATPVEKPKTKRATTKKETPKKSTPKSKGIAKPKAKPAAGTKASTDHSTNTTASAWTGNHQLSVSPGPVSSMPLSPHVSRTVKYTLGGAECIETISSGDFNTTCVDAGQAILDYIPNVLSNMSDVILALRVIPLPNSPEEFMNSYDLTELLRKPTFWEGIFGSTPRQTYKTYLLKHPSYRGAAAPEIKFCRDLVAAADMASNALTGLVDGNRTLVLLADALSEIRTALTDVIKTGVLSNVDHEVAVARWDVLGTVIKWIGESAVFSAVAEASNSVYTLAEVAASLNQEVANYMNIMQNVHTRTLDKSTSFQDAIKPLVEMENTKATVILKYYNDLCDTVEEIRVTRYHELRLALLNWVELFKTL